MRVLVNGSEHELANNSPLQQLLENLGMTTGRIAIELNGEIVPRSTFADVTLGEGDNIEIVQAIGGG